MLRSPERWFVGLVLAVVVGSARADVELVPVGLGKGPAGEKLEKAEAGYVVHGQGREAYLGRDEGTFAYVKTDAAEWTFTARIAKVEGNSPNPKYGLSVRTGLSGIGEALQVRYDGYSGNRCIQWFLRHHIAPDPHNGAKATFVDGLEKPFKATSGFWLRIRRKYPFFEIYYSTDGQSFKPIAEEYRFALAQETVYVGPQVTAGGSGKGPLKVSFDNIDFQAGQAKARAPFTQAPRGDETWVMHLIQADVAGDSDQAAAYLLLPKGVDISEIRALVYSAGSKEIVLADGSTLAWESGQGRLRRPRGMDDWTGTREIGNMRPFYTALRNYRVARLGGVFQGRDLVAVTRQLAKAFDMPQVANLPWVVTGDSFAGGMSAQTAARHSQRTIASAPVIIGAAGSNTNDRLVLNVPHMHVFGSRDGVHLRQIRQAFPRLRQKRARWAAAPMWWVAHRHHRADAIIYPFFLETMRLRLPEKHDYAKGPADLEALPEAIGWLGHMDSWETAYPRAEKYRPGAPADTVWLPSETVARVWQSFVSQTPRTVIHKPRFDGMPGFTGKLRKDWVNESLPAGEPFWVLASGPRGPGVSIEYYAGKKKLRVLEGGGHLVKLEGLPVGLHAIHAVTALPDGSDISNPVLIPFVPNK